MHTHLLQKSLVAAALACAFAGVPVTQALAQDSGQQGSSTEASQAMHSGAMQANQAEDNQTVPGKANDAWITTKVKSKLATAKNIKATDINVDTTEGKVTLTGTVATESAKKHAVREAKSVKGVKSVDASGLSVGDM